MIETRICDCGHPEWSHEADTGAEGSEDGLCWDDPEGDCPCERFCESAAEPQTEAGRAVVAATASDPFIPDDQKAELRAAALRTVLAIEDQAREAAERSVAAPLDTRLIADILQGGGHFDGYALFIEHGAEIADEYALLAEPAA